MTAKESATWKWAIGIIVTLGLVIAANTLATGIFQGQTAEKTRHNHEEIVGVKSVIKDEIKPALARSIKHVDQSKIETPMILHKIGKLETAVEKFRTEQTSMKTEILNAVREGNDRPDNP